MQIYPLQHGLSNHKIIRENETPIMVAMGVLFYATDKVSDKVMLFSGIC